MNWAFAFIFVTSPIALQDKIFFGGVSVVILHVDNSHNPVPDYADAITPHLLHDHVRFSNESRDHLSGFSLVGDVVLVRHYLLCLCIAKPQTIPQGFLSGYTGVRSHAVASSLSLSGIPSYLCGFDNLRAARISCGGRDFLGLF